MLCNICNERKVWNISKRCLECNVSKFKYGDGFRNKVIPKEYLKELECITGRDRNREYVRIRDKHTCQDCKKIWVKKTRRFDVHHLNGLCGKKSKGYDCVKDMQGLVTLCHKCHYNRPEHRCKDSKFGKKFST